MPASNIEPGCENLLFVPEEWYGHEIAAEEDQRTYEEEAVTGAAYAKHVEEKLETVIRRDPPEMTREEFDKLSRYIETEHLLRGVSVRQAIGRSARRLRQESDIKTIVD